MTDPTHPMDGFDVPALRSMLDRFERALRDARLASLRAEGLSEPEAGDDPPGTARPG